MVFCTILNAYHAIEGKIRICELDVRKMSQQYL